MSRGPLWFCAICHIYRVGRQMGVDSNQAGANDLPLSISCTPLVHTSKRRPNQIHLPARFRFRPFELTAHQFGTLRDNAAIEPAAKAE